jgi:hypothetical protein
LPPAGPGLRRRPLKLTLPIGSGPKIKAACLCAVDAKKYAQRPGELGPEEVLFAACGVFGRWPSVLILLTG